MGKTFKDKSKWYRKCRGENSDEEFNRRHNKRKTQLKELEEGGFLEDFDEDDLPLSEDDEY